ncbi:hypothetical protein [Aquamicrobium terrae]|uniref:Uncharacterized protein n=1 Tax=Aquamicrobium terrae TaxID=1324945 RepID=A0ABV2MYC0_9HYPH
MNTIRPIPTHQPLPTDIEFCAWIGQAEPGDWLEYHRGFLVVDAAKMVSTLSKPERVRLRALARVVHRAFEMGLVHPVQARLGPDDFAYLAIARTKPRNAPVSLARLITEPMAA